MVMRVEESLRFIKDNHKEPVRLLAEHAGTDIEYFEVLINRNYPSNFIGECLVGLVEVGMCGNQLAKEGVIDVKGLADEMTDLYKRKNSDYGNSFEKSMNKFGLVVSAIRMGDKINRLQSLVTNKSEAQVKDESIADTFMDLACYAIMSVMWYNNKLNEESKQNQE